jgi:large subunit ribosomal protein L4
MAFPPSNRSFDIKVNRKVRKGALRAALTGHAARSALAVVEGASFQTPSTKGALAFLEGWDAELPVLVVCQPEEEALAKSFRNLAGVLVLETAALEVGAIIWAHSLLVSEAALVEIQRRAA